MKLLLDTHALLWWVDDDSRLGKKARVAISTHGACVSLVTAWELAIKIGLGKLRLAMPVGRYFSEHILDNGFETLPIDLRQIALLESLPHHHGDPFDRLLAAQALTLGLCIVSNDKVFGKYGLKRVW